MSATAAEILLPARPDVLEALKHEPPEKVAQQFPAAVLPWAELAFDAREQGDTVQAYAFSRVGIHRGFEALHESGWEGEGHIPWSHRPNRGFLRCVYVLLKTAKTLGNEEEVERFHTFLVESSPETFEAIEGPTSIADPPTETVIFRAVD